jgi:hypothetical protein
MVETMDGLNAGEDERRADELYEESDEEEEEGEEEEDFEDEWSDDEEWEEW